MPFCRNCGSALAGETCTMCGKKEAAPIASGVLNVGHLIWSILNIVLLGGVLGLPLGIVALIMTVLAKDARTAKDEMQKLKIAKICNLLATVISVALIVAFVSLYVGIFILALVAAV